MTVLIITKSDDNDCIPSVTRAVEARGGQTVRFDTDRFPTELTLDLRQDGSGRRLTLRSDGIETDLSQISAVWYRRARYGAQLPDSMDKQYRRASAREIQATVQGLLASLDAFVMDPLPLVRLAGNKQLQLQIAQDVGLETPATLITSDPDAVRSFFESNETGTVAKMLSSFAIFDDDGKENVVFTTPLKQENLAKLDSLHLCPMTFQAMVPKRLELRVTVVGDRVFTAAIDSQSTERAKVDWRREGDAFLDQWKAYDLPPDVERRVLCLMDHFGLNYGAVDIIVTPDDRYVFLEVNPVGEFFWLELCPGHPIGKAIADVLLGRAFRRVHALPGPCTSTRQ